LKTWEICFVVDLPAFNVLRQLTKLHVLQNVLALVRCSICIMIHVIKPIDGQF